MTIRNLSTRHAMVASNLKILDALNVLTDFSFNIT
jgi:hypothetical protein